jgi:hypothetical protein
MSWQVVPLSPSGMFHPAHVVLSAEHAEQHAASASDGFSPVSVLYTVPLRQSSILDTSREGHE